MNHYALYSVREYDQHELYLHYFSNACCIINALGSYLFHLDITQPSPRKTGYMINLFSRRKEQCKISPYYLDLVFHSLTVPYSGTTGFPRCTKT